MSEGPISDPTSAGVSGPVPESIASLRARRASLHGAAPSTASERSLLAVTMDLTPQAALFDVPVDGHDPTFLAILEKHGFADAELPVPLRARYTKGRRWTAEELEWAYDQWEAGATFNAITARLNRNPQDIIFKLLDLCRERGTTFSEAGRNVGSSNWNPEVEACATELFAESLPAWKIALVFGVDFEHCEKRLYAARSDYGHNKRNPFAICTDHKRLVNAALARSLVPPDASVFEGYAGEGLSTNGYVNALPQASFVAVEQDAETAERLEAAIVDPSRVEIVRDSARRALLRRILEEPGKAFDLIDLDPFVSCADAIEPGLELAKDGTLFFVTFGGEYRRCFIKSNRKSLAKRYRVQLSDASNSEALEEMPRFMLGELASRAMTLGLLVEPLLVIRYPMVVRAYLRLRKPKSLQALLDGYNARVTRDERGARFDVPIPKWRTVDASDPLAAAAEDHRHIPRTRR